MQEFGERRRHPRLKELVQEASRALAQLDADRLEELALSCQLLNRDLVQRNGLQTHARGGRELAEEAREAAGDMAVFARVLEATRANLSVMRRLRALREGRFDYGEQRQQGWPRTGSEHGDN